MPEYTVLTVLAVAAVVAAELCWWRTGVFRTLRYWIVMVIVALFQIPVDGYLTRLADPVVIYDNAQTTGIRWPLDIPVEDFGFGFAMVTLTILLWRRLTERSSTAGPTPTEPGTAEHETAEPESAERTGARPATDEPAATGDRAGMTTPDRKDHG